MTTSAGGGPSIPVFAIDATVAMSGLGPVSFFGMFSWLVPGFLLGAPGLLILVVLAGQSLGGGLFVPITRRVLGGFGLGRRRSEHEGRSA